MNREPVRSAVAVVIAVVGLLQVLGVIDAGTAANIVGAVTLIVGGEVARSKVTPV
jgi:hypothetical protein